jgi:hypothetical protein
MTLFIHLLKNQTDLRSSLLNTTMTTTVIATTVITTNEVKLLGSEYPYLPIVE